MYKRDKSIFICNGAKGHSNYIRPEDDFYASEPKCATLLMEIEPQITNIWENAVGQGHLAEEFRKAGKLGAVSDLYYRGYEPLGIPTTYNLDFLKCNKVWNGDIVTNPPFKNHTEWVIKSLNCITEGHYLALFLKITFLEGKKENNFLMSFHLLEFGYHHQG